MNIDQTIFKAYDIRGIYPEQIDEKLVYKIARAYAEFLKPKKVAVGHDMRLSGESFAKALIEGLTDSGVDVVDLGLISTDQMYFGVVHLGLDGGIIATASHNPKEYGGMKMVREKALPISGDSGVYQIRDMVVAGEFGQVSSSEKGNIEPADIRDAFYQHVLKTFDLGKVKPLRVVAHCNFGMACVAVKKLKMLLPVQFVDILDGELDGSFPKGPPDPLLPGNRADMSAALKKADADLGVAWDGDGDRCFFYDEKGEFAQPGHMNALLSAFYLKRFPGGKIIHDTRVTHVIDDLVEQNGGISIMNKAGHSFIKERMIKEDAVFGSENAAHYFFKDNFYLDNGLMPFLAVLTLISESGKSFSEILRPLREKYFISEEITFNYENQNILDAIKSKYGDAEIDDVDGYDFNFPDWRFNLRFSNTSNNLLKLTLEANSADQLAQKTEELTSLIVKNK